MPKPLVIVESPAKARTLSRFLGDDYRKQIEVVSQATNGAAVAGWETYGEIALTPNQASGFHNSTSVVAVIPA